MGLNTEQRTEGHREDTMQSEKAIILDMDGVLLQTHHLHAAAWKKMFDEFLGARGGRAFDLEADYREYVDGMPRHDGLKSFLRSRNITLPVGSESDPPGAETVYGLGNKKQAYYQDLLEQKGPKVYKDSLAAVKRWTNQHVPLAVVSSSKSCKQVLRMGNIEIFFDAIIDPQLASKQELKGKPEPDYFLHGAELLGFKPKDCLVVEDSQAGVKAAKKGGFYKVYGIVHEPDHQRERELRQAGADKIIHSLEEINPSEYGMSNGFVEASLSSFGF